MSQLNRIEKEFNIANIKHDGVCIWPIIKSYLITLEPTKSEILKKPKSIIKLLLKNLFLDIFSTHKIFKSKIWVFTNSERRYAINNSYFDRVTSGLLDYFDNYVLFENPIPKGRSSKNKLQKGEFLIGMSWIYLIQFLILKFSKTPRIEAFVDLENYLEQDLSKIKDIYHRYHAGYLFYNFLFKFIKPKGVFLVCYYSNFGLVKACKKNRIPVLELQHGIVTKNHRAYNFAKTLNGPFTPDYFLSYGPYFNSIVKNGNLVLKKNTLNYGYSFLYEANKKLRKTDEIEKLLTKFNKVICITGQLENTDRKLLKLVGNVSDEFADICFVYKPRNKNNMVTFKEKSNFIKWEDINTYLLMKYCDYHITIYSTCAIESIALGTPNIAINIDNLYSAHLKDIIGDNEYNHVVDSEKELNKLLLRLSNTNYNNKMVVQSISNVISPMISKELFSNFFNKVVKEKSNHH
ncbi:Protein of unknown function [Maribacter stanieri]|uniref:Uncharacterized protein n=1 Tax=Maribacter stanieri TaxID=440514 RepID=A0A1I6HUE7_9FLAO|nr:Protein of unknown function [Maribacter stanieri]